MNTAATLEKEREELAKRRVPCVIAYLSPFRLVEAEGSLEWSATIEQVNSKGWDYVALHEMVAGLDVGLASPYHLVICRDGALALPPLPELRSDQKIAEFFNIALVLSSLAEFIVRPSLRMVWTSDRSSTGNMFEALDRDRLRRIGSTIMSGTGNRPLLRPSHYFSHARSA